MNKTDIKERHINYCSECQHYYVSLPLKVTITLDREFKYCNYCLFSHEDCDYCIFFKENLYFAKDHKSIKRCQKCIDIFGTKPRHEV